MKKTGKRTKIFALLLALMMIFSVLPATDLEVSAAGTIAISKTSATIEKGSTLQLSASVDGVQTTATWASSDATVASVDGTGLVTAVGCGSAVITAIVNGSSVECIVSVVSNTARYNVLILDASSSVKGVPLAREKEAAKRFCKTILESDGTNRVAIITMCTNATVIQKPTKYYSKAEKAIDSVVAKGSTNMNEAFEKAEELLDATPSGTNVMRNIVLCSDGLPYTGTKSASGRYTSADHAKYKLANAVYKTDVKVKKKGYFVYALGFFHNSKGTDLTFGKRFMKDLASKDKYYVVTDPEDIDDAMDRIATQITNMTINKTKVNCYNGNQTQLVAYVNGVETPANWSSSNEAVATVDSTGLVTAVSTGKAVITSEIDGNTEECVVQVYNDPTLTISKTKTSVYRDCSTTLTATATGISKTVKWVSSDKTIAKVSSKGVITGVKPGTCIVTAKANGLTCECTVTVKKPTIALNKTSKVIYLKESFKLKATVHGKSKKVTWKSTKKSVATVTSSGKVTGKKEGTTYIVAKANGVTAKCKVQVERKHPPYSFYVTTNKAKTNLGSKYINEQGGMLKYNEDGKITKAAVYIYKSGGYYRFIFACKGENLTSVECDCYLGYNGKKIYDHYNTVGHSHYMNTFYLYKDSYGIYSKGGSYGDVYFNVTDKNGKLLTCKSKGANGKYFKVFSSLARMKKWLQAD